MKRICYLLSLFFSPITLFYYTFFFPSWSSLARFFPYTTIIHNRIKLWHFPMDIIFNLIIYKSSCCPRIYGIIYHGKTNYIPRENILKFKRLFINQLYSWPGCPEIYIQLTGNRQVNIRSLFVLVSLGGEVDCPLLFDPHPKKQ